MTAPISRRTLLRRMANGAMILAIPLPGLALPTGVNESIVNLFGDREVKEGRVQIRIPKITENGYSVPLEVDVDSPMTESDYVSHIAVFAEKNPLPDVARFSLGARAGKASVRTRIRLGGSQHIRVIAEMNDGSLWASEAFAIVTLAACVL